MVLTAILLFSQIDDLYNYLNSEKSSVRKEALTALYTLKPEKLKIDLIRERLKDADYDVIIEAAKLLHLYNDQTGLATLKNILKQASTPPHAVSPMERIKYLKISYARKKIAFYFGEVKLIDELIKYKDDSDGIVRDAVRAALARNGFTEFKNEFIEALKSNNDSKRLSASEMLLYIEDKQNLIKLKKDPMDLIRRNVAKAHSKEINIQVEYLNDISSIVKEEALKNILEYGKISELKNIKAKFEEMSKEMDASVMIYSNVVLLKMGNESSIYIIENAAKNSDPDIRKYAAYTLKFLDKKHKDRIYEILKNDQDPIVKILAITYYNAR